MTTIIVHEEKGRALFAGNMLLLGAYARGTSSFECHRKKKEIQ
jgi:hypothetical protein